VPAGTYAYTVTDNVGTVKTGSVVLTSPGPLNAMVTIVSHSGCNGLCGDAASVEITGRYPPYSDLWSNGEMREDADWLRPDEQEVWIKDERLTVHQ